MTPKSEYKAFKKADKKEEFKKEKGSKTKALKYKTESECEECGKNKCICK